MMAALPSMRGVRNACDDQPHTSRKLTGGSLMARQANEKNAPEQDDVQGAVRSIEQCDAELMRERGVYMQKCRKIREAMAHEYDMASDKGISKKLLKKIVKERELERRIAGLTDDLEPDEISEHQMLLEK